MSHRLESSTVDRIHRIDRQYRFYRTMLAWLVAVGFVVNGALFYLASRPERPGSALMQLMEPRVLSSTELCPGETLRYELPLVVSGPGVFAVDRTIWRITPPSTIIFSRTSHAVFAEPTLFSAARNWTVPAGYIDPTTERLTPWRPGRYEIRHATSTSSRSTMPSIQVIPFSIRSDCQ